MFYLLYATIVVVFFDNFSQVPVMSPFAKSLGASVVMTSIIVVAYSFSNMIGNFYAGFFIDRFGRLTSIVIGLVIAGLAVLNYSFVDSTVQLLVLRIVHGLGIAVVVPAAFALLGDISAQAARGREMARAGIAISIAALLGPPFGGLIKAYSSMFLLFQVVGVLLLVMALIVKLSKDFDKGENFKKEAETREVFRLGAVGTVLLKKELWVAYFGALFLMIAKGTLTVTLPLQVEALGFTSAFTGFLFSSFALSAIAIFATPLSRLSDQEGRLKPIIGGLVLIGCSLGLLSFATSPTSLISIMLLYGIGFGFLFPACTALVVDETEVWERGKAFGIFYGVFSLGVVIGPVISSFFSKVMNPLLVASLMVFLGVLVILALGHWILKK